MAAEHRREMWRRGAVAAQDLGDMLPAAARLAAGGGDAGAQYPSSSAPIDRLFPIRYHFRCARYQLPI